MCSFTSCNNSDTKSNSVNSNESSLNETLPSEDVSKNDVKDEVKVGSADSNKNTTISNSKFEKNWYYDYFGTIGKNLTVRMTLYQQGEEMVGSYYYENVGKELKIKGKIENNNIILHEFNEYGMETGIFRSKVNTVDSLEVSGKIQQEKICFHLSCH